jgi:CRISPR/Cas system CSM-associated protein Csm5 (group 7 of RAMP superfamily)
MSEKAHNISSLPDSANQAGQDAMEEAEKAPGKVKNFVRKNKNFFIGLGSGIAATTAVLFLAKAQADEEEPDVLVVETPED